MTGPESVQALPATMRIGPFDWRLEKWTPQQAAGARRYGECSSIELRISVQENQASAVAVVDTLFHEIGHALFFVSNLSDTDNEERTVGVLATGWTQIYRDNPWLLDWIKAAVA